MSDSDTGRSAAADADRAPRTPGPRSSPPPAPCSPPAASAARRCGRSPRTPASTRRWCTTTSAPRTTCSSPRWSSRSTRGSCCSPVLEGGLDGAGERLLRVFLVGLGRRDRTALPARAGPRRVRADGRQLLRDGLLGVVLGPVGAGARDRRAGAADALVASQMIGLVMLRYVLEVEPLASMDAGPAGRDVRPDAAALPRPEDAATLDGRGPSAWIIHHMMKNAVEVRGARVSRGVATRCCAGSTSRSRPAR